MRDCLRLLQKVLLPSITYLRKQLDTHISQAAQVNTSLILQNVLSMMEIHFTVQVLLKSSERWLSQKTSIRGSVRVLEDQSTC